MAWEALGSRGAIRGASSGVLGAGLPPSSRPDGGGAAAEEDASCIQARTPQAAQANTGPQSLVLGQVKAARRPREPRESGWRWIVLLGPQPRPGAGLLVLESVDLAASGEGRGGGAPGGPAGPPPLPPSPFVSRRFFAGRSLARAPQASVRGRGGEGLRGGFLAPGPAPPRGWGKGLRQARYARSKRPTPLGLWASG